MDNSGEGLPGEGEGGNDGGEQTLDIGDTMAEILRERGEQVGDGNPPAEPEPTPEDSGGDQTSDPEPAKAPADPSPDVPGWQRPPDLTKAPESWKPEVRAAWATLPPEVRAEIYRREQDSAKGFAEIKPFVDTGKRFSEVLKPWKQEMESYGVDPYLLFNNFAQAHKTLSLGTPEEKRAMFAQLSAQYQIPLPAGKEAAPPGEEGWVDPQVKTLLEKVNKLESGVESQNQLRAAERRSQVANEVNAFSKSPDNPHFDEVSHEMARLLGADKSLTLKEAYDKACWIVPAIREKLISEQADKVRKEEEAAERERAKSAAAARGGPPKSKSNSASATGKLGTIDDTMKETLAVINGRAK